MGRRSGSRILVALATTLFVVGVLAACGGSGGGGPSSAGDPVALIGKSFEDPDVSSLVRGMCGGYPHDNAGNVKCLGSGFELNLLSDLSVGSVTLYNQESQGFSRYRGTLPYGLTWDDTYPSVLDKLGQPNAQYGGNGVDVYLVYGQPGALAVEVHFFARHNNPEDLADSHIHMIYVYT